MLHLPQLLLLSTSCLSFNKKVLGILKGRKKKDRKKKNQSEETNHASEPGSGMADILKLSDLEFKINKINVLRTLMKKGGKM